MLKIRTRQIMDLLFDLEERDDKLHGKVLKFLKELVKGEVVKYRKLGEEIRFLVEKNVVFVNPIESVVKPQSRLDLLAIKRVLGDIDGVSR
jgi:hypothetical protein